MEVSTIKSEKKVGLLVPFSAYGGAARIAAQLSMVFKSVIALFDDRNTYQYRGKVYNFNTPATNNPIRKIFNLFKRVRKFKSLLKKEKPFKVLSFLESANFLNILVNWKRAIITVHEHKSSNRSGFYSSLYRLLIRLLYNRAQRIVCVSKGIKEDLVKNFGIRSKKLSVIYNPHPINRIQELSLEPLPEEIAEIFIKYPIIINTGRLTRQKGQWHLIRAFRRVKELIPQSKLVILGEGELKNYLKELIELFKLEDDVLLLGFKKNPFQFIARATVFAFASLWEGLPNSLIEAMACRVPVISTDCLSGPREILSPDTDLGLSAQEIEYAQYGILIPVCDSNFYKNEPLTREETILAEALVSLLKDEGLRSRYSTLGFLRSLDFDLPKIINQYSLLLANR